MGEAAKARMSRVLFWRRRGTRAAPATMTVVDHLRELRGRLVKSLAAFAIISVAVFFLYEPILEVLRRPLCSVDPDLLGPQGCRLVYIKTLGGFQFRLKLTTMVGLAVASPVWLYQIWAFIVPALTSRERRYALPFMASAIVLFVAGTTLGFYTLRKGLEVMISLGGDDLTPFLGAEEYLSFVGLMLLGFGIAFQLPLVLIFLGLAGAVTVDSLRSHRKLALVLIFVASAVITPTQDPITMSLMAVPLYGLYELTILILKMVLRRRARGAAAESP